MLHRLDIQRLSGKKQSKKTWSLQSTFFLVISFYQFLNDVLLGNRQVKTFEANLTMTEVKFNVCSSRQTILRDFYSFSWPSMTVFFVMIWWRWKMFGRSGLVTCPEQVTPVCQTQVECDNQNHVITMWPSLKSCDWITVNTHETVAMIIQYIARLVVSVLLYEDIVHTCSMSDKSELKWSIGAMIFLLIFMS
jgi:hypothetical protein